MFCRTSRIRLTVAVSLASVVVSVGSSLVMNGSTGAVEAAAPCSTTGTGGDWPTYGHDLANTRSQPSESGISLLNVSRLKKAWTFVPVENGQHAALNSTATEDGGCVFVGTSAGFVYALAIGDGHTIWKRQLPVTAAGLGGVIVGAIVVQGDRLFALVNEQADGMGSGPYAVALDKQTGDVVWRSAPLDTRAGYYTNASPVVSNGVLIAGWSPPESNPTGQGGLVLIDAADGSTLKKVYTIPLDRQALGRAGGGIWTSPAVDTAGFAYAGTGNPYNKDLQDPNTNAIIKVDVSRSRPTFGEIVGSYPGNIDTYTAELQSVQNTQICKSTTQYFTSSFFDDPLCGQLDLDFGAAPNLFAINGRQVIGDLQKAGVYHAAYTDTMSEAWGAIVGTPCVVCNGSSTASAGGRIYGEAVLGGQAFALDQATGKHKWVTPVLDAIHFESVSVANNIVYTIDSLGFLDAFEARTGLTLARRPLLADSGQVLVNLSSSGVSIARNRVFATVGSLVQPGVPIPAKGYLVAYTAP